MYETGIAHTLGKVVIPITQNISDMGHHKALYYLHNREGLTELTNKLAAIDFQKINFLISKKLL